MNFKGKKIRKKKREYKNIGVKIQEFSETYSQTAWE